MADRFGTSKGRFHESIKLISSCLVAVMQESQTKLKSQKQAKVLVKIVNFRMLLVQLMDVIFRLKLLSNNHKLFIPGKKFYSIAVLTCCNSKMDFTYFWEGNQDGTHDATVLRMSDLYFHSFILYFLQLEIYVIIHMIM